MIKCELCNTVLSWSPDGKRTVEFTGHTDEYCRTATLERIRSLEQAVRSNANELWRTRLSSVIESQQPPCALCRKGPGVYAGWCSECVSDHDL